MLERGKHMDALQWMCGMKIIKTHRGEHKLRPLRYHTFISVQHYTFSYILVDADAQIETRMDPGVTAAFCCGLCCQSQEVKCLAQGHVSSSCQRRLSLCRFFSIQNLKICFTNLFRFCRPHHDLCYCGRLCFLAQISS